MLLYSDNPCLLSAKCKVQFQFKSAKTLSVVVIIPAIFLLVYMERSFCSSNCSRRREWAVQGEQTNPFGSIWKPLPPITWFSICHPFIARKQKHTMKKMKRHWNVEQNYNPQKKHSSAVCPCWALTHHLSYISIHTWKPQKQQLDLAELQSILLPHNECMLYIEMVNIFDGRQQLFFSSLCVCGAANMIVLTKGAPGLIFEADHRQSKSVSANTGHWSWGLFIVFLLV